MSCLGPEDCHCKCDPELIPDPAPDLTIAGWSRKLSDDGEGVTYIAPGYTGETWKVTYSKTEPHLVELSPGWWGVRLR